MLTSLGKFLRKLRIDRGEKLKDMADQLNVSSAFLSAVENGKKKMPIEWNQRIPSVYELNDEQCENFFQAAAEAEEFIAMNFSETAEQNRKLAVSFARKFNDFDEAQIDAIRKIIKGENNF